MYQSLFGENSQYRDFKKSQSYAESPPVFPCKQVAKIGQVEHLDSIIHVCTTDTVDYSDFEQLLTKN